MKSIYDVRSLQNNAFLCALRGYNICVSHVGENVFLCALLGQNIYVSHVGEKTEYKNDFVCALCTEGIEYLYFSCWPKDKVDGQYDEERDHTLKFPSIFR